MERTETFCDKCNPQMDRTKSFVLPNTWAKALGLDTSQGPVTIIRGVHYGLQSEAYEIGWEARDYGDVCPICAFDERYEEEEVANGAVRHGAGQQNVLGYRHETEDLDSPPELVTKL